MELKTKYQIGDKIVAFDVKNGKLDEFEVKSICIFIEVDHIDVTYYKDIVTSYSQQVCALSREDFINSL